MKAILSLFFICCLSFTQAQPCIPNTNSLSFDGTGSYVDMGAASNIDTITGPVTVEAWIFPDAFGFNMAQNTIFCTHGWTSGEQGMVLRVGGDGILSFNFAGLDTLSVPVSWQEALSPINSLQLNTWTHVAGTFSGTELKVFVNGTEVASTPFTGSIVPSTYGVKIGKLADDNQVPGRYFSGLIDEVRIWNRALSSAELSASASKHIDPFSAIGLVAYWRFFEGIGTTAADLGSGSNTGNILNANWSTSTPFNEVPPNPVISWNGTALIANTLQNNQWNLGGNPINGATGSSYVPTQNGTYTVIFTAPNGCSSISLPFLLTTVGINSQDSPVQMKVWPNPVTAQLNIEVDLLLKTKFDVIIYDINQRQIRQEHFENYGGGTLILNTSDFPQGVYGLALISGDLLKNIKFVVQ